MIIKIPFIRHNLSLTYDHEWEMKMRRRKKKMIPRLVHEAVQAEKKLEENFEVDGKKYLVRCPKCKRENYAPAVSSGQCAWCGYKEE